MVDAIVESIMADVGNIPSLSGNFAKAYGLEVAHQGLEFSEASPAENFSPSHSWTAHVENGRGAGDIGIG